MQDANFRLPIWVDDKLCINKNIMSNQLPSDGEMIPGLCGVSIRLTFLSGSVLDRQCDEFLVGRKDGPLRFCLLPLHVSVELSALGPGAKLLNGDLFKVEAFFQVKTEFFKFCREIRFNQLNPNLY